MFNKLLIALCAVSLSFAVACSSNEPTPDAVHTEAAVEQAEEEPVAVEEVEEVDEAVAVEEDATEGELAEDSEPAEDAEEGM